MITVSTMLGQHMHVYRTHDMDKYMSPATFGPIRIQT